MRGFGLACLHVAANITAELRQPAASLLLAQLRAGLTECIVVDLYLAGDLTHRTHSLDDSPGTT